MSEAHEKYKLEEEEEEEEVYILLDLDDCLYSDIPPNAPYVLSIGEYEETVGTSYLFSESDAPPKPVHDEMPPSGENKDKHASSGKEAPSKEVKHLARVHKILKFRSINVDHQQHRAYQAISMRTGKFETKLVAVFYLMSTVVGVPTPWLSG